MGLSKSKPKPRKGEEQRKGSSYSSSKSKDRLSEKHSLEAEKLADSHFLRKGSAKHERPSASSEGWSRFANSPETGGPMRHWSGQDPCQQGTACWKGTRQQLSHSTFSEAGT
ncbi:spermatogenesis-associated protein 33 isoform X2 [Marmota monax]|uniref:spermatogenesis-associated protein 33 isoform X2 n=1 Tax=Marmota monax TaxID=9995 RepID=UPI0026EF11AD|nr:spermatogenesis-associated protein 33 isoform X2 [Marmota monax]